MRRDGQIEEGLARAAPGDWKEESELANVYQNMAGAYFALGDWRNSEAYRARSLEVFERLHKTFPNNESYEFEVANAHLRMANVQEQMKRI